MKYLVIVFALAGSSIASAMVCDGVLTIDNIGRVTQQAATMTFTSDLEAVYQGPHASIDLGASVALTFKQQENGWKIADLSGDGHGGETNIFWVKDVSASEKNFVYTGSYGYRAEGILTCK